MHLVINAHGLAPGRVGGLETAFREVFGRILQWRLPGLEVSILTSPSNHFSFEPWSRLADLRQLPDDASEEALDRELAGADLLYCPLMFLAPRRPRIPAVVFIPDLQHEVYPEFFSPELLAKRTSALRAGASRCEAVVTISEFSARRIRRSLRLPGERVIPIPLDAAASFRAPARPEGLEELRARLDLPEQWLLLPANNWPHKNHRRIFAALARYREAHGDPPTLLLTGASVGSVDIEAEIGAAGLEGLVRHLGWISPNDMPLLYDGARCLLFSTLYEGFGIPLVEALRRGTPILASRDSCAEEITGRHAVLVDPLDAHDIAEGLHRVLAQEHDASAARARAERFSYDRAARSMWQLLERAVSAGRRGPRQLSVESWPRFFVVTPSLNQAKYLRSTIDSVLDQTYPHLSYFVADGGSTDESVEILRSYGDRLSWVSRPDGGQAAAVSKAWSESDADVVAYLNSDDVYLPLAVTRAAVELLRRPEASVVYGKAWVIDEAGRTLRPYKTEPFSADRLAAECFISQPAAFVRREVFRVIGPLDPDLHYCMDYDLWIRIARWFELAYLEEFLAGSREHPDTKTQRDRDQVYREILQVTTKHYGLPSRSWAVAAILNRCRQEVTPTPGPESAESLARARARLAQQREAEIVAPPYPDGWAGTATLVEVVPDANGRVRLPGESPIWPHPDPLRIRVEQAGRAIGQTVIEGRGAFELSFEVGSSVDGNRGSTRVLLKANRTFVPLAHGYSTFDDRPVSFLLR